MRSTALLQTKNRRRIALMLRRVFAFVAVFAACITSSQAAVTRVEVADRADLPINGYERIAGKVYFAVDPKLPANRAIADINLAPKERSRGWSTFPPSFLILRPKDAAKSNGTAFLEIANRGTSPFWGSLNIGAGRGMRTMQDLGDHFMLDQGFTLVWVGWQTDVAGAGNF